MPRYVKRSFTAEAVLVGCLFALLMGVVVGLATGLLTMSPAIGVGVGAVMTLFSLDMIFRGTN